MTGCSEPPSRCNPRPHQSAIGISVAAALKQRRQRTFLRNLASQARQQIGSMALHTSRQCIAKLKR